MNDDKTGKVAINKTGPDLTCRNGSGYVPVTFYTAPPVGVSAWHRQWVKGQIAQDATVPCDQCAAPCCTTFDFIELDPRVDDVSQYATQQTEDGRTVLQQQADGSCLYFVDGRCSIHMRRPLVCRVFDCRIYHFLPPATYLDAIGWVGPCRDQAEHLRATATERFPFVVKEPDDRTFARRFIDVFNAVNAQWNVLHLSALLDLALMRMTDEPTFRRYVAARERAELRRHRNGPESADSGAIAARDDACRK